MLQAGQSRLDLYSHHDQSGGCNVQHVFYVQEILSLICEELRLDSALPALASLARTSKALCHAAIESLWFNLPSLLPLATMMPDDMWDIGEEWRHGELVTSMDICRPLRLTDWQLVEPRLRLVRSFGFSQLSYGRATTDISVFEALAVFLDRTPLFPNLRQLDWRWADTSTFPYISLFLLPSLTAIHLDLVDDSTSVRLSLLATLNRRCPSIIEATFETNGDKWSQDALSVVYGWPNLAILDVDAVSPEPYMYLAALPTLTSLTVRELDDLSWDSIDTKSPDCGHFLNLQHLHIADSSPESCICMLKTLSSSLRSFDLEPTSAISPAEWEEIHELLRRRCNPQYPLKISINGCYCEEDNPEHDDMNPADYRLSIANLSPLLTFNNLASITLRPNSDIDLDDEAIKRLAIAWPNLRCLTILTKYTCEGSVRPTLRCLEYLAQSCLRLQELALILDACLPAIDDLSSRPRSACPLSRIDIGQSPIDDPPIVAGVLAHFFPKVKHVGKRIVHGDTDLSFNTIHTWYRKWEDVNDLLDPVSSER